MFRRLASLILGCLLAFPAWADGAEDAALKEIASALVWGDSYGPYGARYYQSLPIVDGKRLVRIYAAPYPRELAFVQKNLWYELADARVLDEKMKSWMLETYNREFPQMKFEFTNDPNDANLFTVEARFVPNATSGKSRPAEAYYKTAANSMNASIAGKRRALVHFNTLGNPWLGQAIAENLGPVVRAIMLNEMFNGFAVRDFQELDESKLSKPTRDWLEAHRANIDDYTITRSGGPREDEHLKPLDRIILQQILR